MLDGVHRICDDPAGHTWMKWRYSAHMFLSLGHLWLARGDARKAEDFAERCLAIATKTTYFHGGSNDGFTCWYLMDIDKNWGYVLFTNSKYGEKLGNELWDYLEKEEY